MTALFLITPETATGSGSLIPGVDIPQPPAAGENPVTLESADTPRLQGLLT